MTIDTFRTDLMKYFDEFKKVIATDDGDWVIKGFIDVYKNIYTISVDTKVISKIIELMLFPIMLKFASEHNYKIIPSEHQNHYPDITFITEDNEKIAVDLKSTYKKSANTVNGFTLGSFTGYFRQRDSTKNITFPYQEYKKHYVLGVIYERTYYDDEFHKYTIDDLKDIISVANSFTFLLQEKWKLARTIPGSGNTKNIGSVKKIDELVDGKGPFSQYGEEVFDGYWTNFLTKDMARAIDSEIPFKNLEQYFEWSKKIKTR